MESPLRYDKPRKFKNQLTSLLPGNRFDNQERQDQQIPRPLRSEIFIRMKLCDGDLRKWLDENTSAANHSIIEMKKWIKQLAEALSYIHQLNLIHRDLKPANIFLLQCNHQPIYPPLVIGDFGLAREVQNQNIERGRNNARRNLDLTNNVGTISYMSPEQMAGEVYDQKVDIFALGLIATELIISFDTDSERAKIFEELKNKDTLREFGIDGFNTAKEFLLLLTKTNPVDRPTAEQILAHQFLTEVQ